VVLILGSLVNGEALWLLPALVFGTPASALAGLLASVVLYRVRAPPVSARHLWLVTAAGAVILSATVTYAITSEVTALDAAALLGGAVVGAIPVFVLARALTGEGLPEAE
jgi:tellurite resistance protein TehA-like permease